MSGSGSFAVTRKHGGDRFYNPPAIRRHQQQQQHQQRHQQQLLLQQQQQLIQRQHDLNQQLQQQQRRRPRVQVQGLLLREDTMDTREASDYSTLSNRSVHVDSTPRAAVLTNIDRIVESVTPFVHAQHFSEDRMRGLRSRESDIYPYFSLGDVWESFKEWSVYGAGVPLELSECKSVKQYYVPSLSGLQLYVDPMRVRKPGDESDVESSRETSSAVSSDCERQANHLNSQRMDNLSLQDNPATRPSTDEANASSNSPGICIFEYLEQEQPYHRKPLFDKISILASQSPELKMYKSCDLSPASWICVAWYPIYRIPVGPTLQNLDASFLTFHTLSTHSTGKNQPQCVNSGGKSSSKISLPVFGLASYKMKGSILTNGGDHEHQQANYLLQAADIWLRSLHVYLPDYQFFVSHNSQGR